MPNRLISNVYASSSSFRTGIVDYFKSIDYKAIGQNLEYALEAAWKAATGLFKSFLNSDASFAGAFSAIGDVLGPTFESIFGTLEIAAKKAFIQMGDAAIRVFNEIGATLTGIYNKIVELFGGIAGVIGGALDYAGQKWESLKSWASGGGSSGGSSGGLSGVLETMYPGIQKTEKGYSIRNPETGLREAYTNPETVKRKLEEEGYRINTVSINYYGEGTVNKVANALPDIVNPLPSAYDYLTGGTIQKDLMELSLAKSGAAGLKAAEEEAEKIRQIPEADRTGTQKAIVKVADTVDYISDAQDDLAKTGREGIKVNEDANKWEREFLTNNQKIWETYESDTWNATKAQWQTDIAQLEELKAARDELHKQGLDDTKGAKDIEAAIEKQGDKIAENVAAAVTGIPATIYDPMYKASFLGQTKDYGTTAQENMQRQAEAALVNAQYGIVAVGSMNEYTQYAKEGLAAAGIEQVSVKSLIDDAIAGLKEEKSVVDDTISATSDLKAASKDVDFVEAKAGAEDLKSTCVDVEFSMENIAAKASQIKFSRSASASPDALKQGIFETSDTDPRTSQPQMAGANAAAGGLSNAALSAMQRYLSQVANNTNRIYNGINTYGRSIFSAVQLAGTNAAAAVNANGSNIASTVNSQGGAIVGAINAGVAALIKVLSDKGSGNMGGPHAGMGGIGSVGGFWDGLNGLGNWGTMSYSTGGYASHPTLAIVGDSPGGEFMVPRDRVGEFVNSYMAHQQTKIDGSGMRSQLMDAVGSLNVPAIHIPVVVDIDSNAIFEAVEYAFKSISSDIRLRARV